MKKTLVILLIPFLILTIVQLCLHYPATRELFTRIDIYESGARSVEVPGGRGYVCLTLVEGTPSDDIVIYFNARRIAKLDYSKLTLMLDCDGVIQIENGTDEKIAVAASCNAPHHIDIVNSSFTKGISALCTFSLG